MAKQRGTKLIANNKKAYHDYFIEDTYEAGIALVGTEVKSLRMGKCSIKEAFVGLDGDEVYVYRMNIHRYEINKLIGQQKMKGYTLVPLKVYFKDSLVKVEIGLARGKKLYDKRDDIAKKDMKREVERDFKIRNLG